MFLNLSLILVELIYQIKILESDAMITYVVHVSLMLGCINITKSPLLGVRAYILLLGCVRTK